ncbi:unnamed protein product [Protopolystoma xenopodis]|uniref:Uncharacterized protein n=1 Tax=Protopolystoma xenopodis TaxID=117903 RepID=A0A448XFW1_9PLAT|nr:unnamed protein product [Protopolystoma xenopodis]
MKGHPVNVPDSAGWLPIHEAAFHNHADVALYLLDKGALLDDPGFPADNSTPLFEAVVNGSLDTALLLIERGADIWHR